MALTVTLPATSSGYLPVGADNIYSVVSDKANNPYSYPNFYYEIMVYISTSGITSQQPTQRLRYNSLVEYNSQSGTYTSKPITFNLNKLVMAYIEPPFENNMSGLCSYFDLDHKPRFVSVLISIKEHWDNDNNSGASYTQSTPIYYWLSAKDWWSSLDAWCSMDSYEWDGVTTGQLSGRPNVLAAKKPSARVDNVIGQTMKVASMGEAYHIGINNPQTFTACIMKDGINDATFGNIYQQMYYVAVYNKNRQITKYMYAFMPYQTMQQNYTNKFVTFPCGACQINKLVDDGVLTVAVFSLGADSHINLQTDKYYQIQLMPIGVESTNVSAYSVPLTFELDASAEGTLRNHRNHPRMSILYWSNDGGWWQIPCHRHNYKTLNVKNSTIQRPNTIQRTYTNVNHREYDVINVTSVTKWSVETDLMIDDSEIAEVEDMLSSPYIYLVDDVNNYTSGTDAIYFPVYIDNYECKIDNEQGISQFIINFNTAYQNKTLK